ncbi:hypothetical protein FH972_024097 [Carpinus fangiana]|uniref:Uncharacterized protein n=1 Tax=Carpinus fangiana TaxID=176857 RepID=A0A5N6KX16_9ROSI|nr:hypothetical protein FH972_024097 [Carpinus fangiana]
MREIPTTAAMRAVVRRAQVETVKAHPFWPERPPHFDGEREPQRCGQQLSAYSLMTRGWRHLTSDCVGPNPPQGQPHRHARRDH